MWKNIGLEQCLTFINCQLGPGQPHGSHGPVRPAITISRLTGAGGHTVAAQLAEILQERAPGTTPWTVFDRQLVEQVLQEHHLPRHVADYMPEKHRSMLKEFFEEVVGLHPSAYTLAQQTAETILHLARLGNVIVVGRAASVVTRQLDNAFHVRLVGSLEHRAAQIQEVYGFDRPTALAFIHREDKGRRQYVKEHFQADPDDPLLYHMTINTDRLAYADAARLIAEETIRRFKLAHPLTARLTYDAPQERSSPRSR